MTKNIQNASDLVTAGEMSEEIEILRHAAKRGDTEAKFRLGLLYYRGQLVPGDLETAWDWLEAADQHGHIRAPYYIGRICTYYAEHRIAMPSQKDKLNPEEIVKEWHETAMQWYERSAARGFHVALARLGINYLNGIGAVRSKEKAFDYFLQAKKAGNIHARGKIIRMLLSFYKGVGGFFMAFYEIFDAARCLIKLYSGKGNNSDEYVKEKFLA